jgi:hypothetical protein
VNSIKGLIGAVARIALVVSVSSAGTYAVSRAIADYRVNTITPYLEGRYIGYWGEEEDAWINEFTQGTAIGAGLIGAAIGTFACASFHLLVASKKGVTLMKEEHENFLLAATSNPLSMHPQSVKSEGRE